MKTKTENKPTGDAEPITAPPPAITWKSATVAIGEIAPNPNQPRDHITPASVAAMADSLTQNGQLEPVLLFPRPGDLEPRYMLIAGERRWRGAQKAGLTTLDARIADACTLAQAQVFALVENLHREDLNAMQAARGFRELVEHGLTHEAIARQVGCDKSTVTNKLRLLKLPDATQKLIAEGKLTEMHGIALLRFEAFPRVVEAIARMAVEDKAPASRLREGLPFYWRLESARPKIACEITARDMIEANVSKKDLATLPWFFAGPHSHYSLDPEASGSWFAEKKKAFEQAQREKAAAELAAWKEKTEKAKAAGKTPPKKPAPAEPKKVNPRTGQVARAMTPAEKRDRAEKIRRNKLNRLQLEAGWEKAQEALKNLRDVESRELALLFDWSTDGRGYGWDADDELQEARAALGITSKPKEFSGHTPLEIVQLALWINLREQMEDARRNARAVPEDMAPYAKGARKVALPEPKAKAAAKPAPTAKKKLAAAAKKKAGAKRKTGGAMKAAAR